MNNIVYNLKGTFYDLRQKTILRAVEEKDLETLFIGGILKVSE